MELRRARARPRGPVHRCPGGDGGGADRLSGLPDDLLLHVLARLRCARAAAHTSLLSRRWRGLWMHLPELSFREISPGALDAALAQVARAELTLLDIDVPERHRFSPARVGSLLRTAARLAPADLRLVVWGLFPDRATAVELPCFHRATSVKLGVWNLVLTFPDPEQGGGVFPVVERLSIDGCSFSFGALVPRCPRLRLLEARHSDDNGTITVHSPTIESLDVDGVLLSSIDIDAPMLKKFTLMGSYTRRDLRVVSFSAPMVGNVHWSAHFFPWWALIGGKWGLRSFSFHLEESGFLLHLQVDAQDFWLTEDVNLMQNIAQFPYFSGLELFLITWGHIYGATVFNVLEVCTDIKMLRLIIRELEI